MDDRLKEVERTAPANPFPEEKGLMPFVLAIYADPDGSHVRLALNEKALPEGITPTQVLINVLRSIISLSARIDPKTFADTDRESEALFPR